MQTRVRNAPRASIQRAAPWGRASGEFSCHRELYWVAVKELTVFQITGLKGSMENKMVSEKMMVT